MPDREKVIGHLNDCMEASRQDNTWVFVRKDIVEDALALLKEQENGKWIDHTFAHGDDIECPFCHKKWNVIDNCTETFDYCPGCGTKLS